MKTLSAAFIVAVAVLSLAFDFLVSGGYTFVEKRGWNVKFGFIQEPFEADIGVSFDFEVASRPMCFDVDVIFPIFDFTLFKSGPILIYVRDNYSGAWNEFAGLGALVQIDTGDFKARFGMVYPVTEEFDITKSLLYELRYYMKPPQGKKFKDKLFVELVYHYGFFRFGIGLIEPIP